MLWALCRGHSDLEGRSLAPCGPFLPLGLPLLSISTYFCNALGSAKVLGHNMSLRGSPARAWDSLALGQE